MTLQPQPPASERVRPRPSPRFTRTQPRPHKGSRTPKASHTPKITKHSHATSHASDGSQHYHAPASTSRLHERDAEAEPDDAATSQNTHNEEKRWNIKGDSLHQAAPGAGSRDDNTASGGEPLEKRTDNARTLDSAQFWRVIGETNERARSQILSENHHHLHHTTAPPAQMSVRAVADEDEEGEPAAEEANGAFDRVFRRGDGTGDAGRQAYSNSHHPRDVEDGDDLDGEGWE